MIQNDQELNVTRERIAYLLDLLTRLRLSSRPEELSLVSSGYRTEVERMQKEVLDYLTKPVAKLDAENRRNLQDYIDNIHVMEELTRVQTNLALLRKHQAGLIDSGKRTVSVELLAVRLGDLVLATFPGELTVRIGLNIKQHSPHPRTWVAGYTNGYIYYAPTADQLRNVGGAQEDSDCILAPEWQELYERHVAEMLKKL